MATLQQINETNIERSNGLDGYDNGLVGSPYAPAPYGEINRNSKDFASKTNALITRNQWADYQQRYMPVHGELIGAVTSPELVNQQVDRVGENVNRSFEQAQEGMNVNRSRMGLGAISQDNSLDKALATTHAKNSIREAGEQRNRTAVTGAANSFAPARSGT